MARHKTMEKPPAQRAVEPGAVVAGCRVQRILWRRAGCAFAEAQTPDGKSLALRIFSPPHGETLRRRVAELGSLREAIDAPLLGVLGAGEDDGLLYVAHAMPRAETLADVLRDGPLDPTAAMTLLGQVAGGLETAALLGLPAAAPAPERILVTSARPRQALLTDYGVGDVREGACADDGLQDVEYLAPEAARGTPTDPASGIYALTCILVEALTGAPPFPFERPLEILHAQLVEDPPPVAERRKGLPAALDLVVATGMNKRPEQRFASPMRLMRAAQKALGVKAPIPVAATARRHVDAAAAAAAAEAARRRAAQRAAQDPPSRPVRPPRAPAPEPEVRRPQRTERHRRRPALWPAPAALAVLMFLLASASAGFAAGHFTGPANRAPSEAAAPPTVPSADLTERADYARGVDNAIETLNSARATARRKLAAARRPAAQAEQAAALAGAYAHAQTLLPARGLARDPLAAPLEGAQGAYRRLAAAARRHDAKAYLRAAKEVVVRERELQRALDRVQSI